MKKNIVLMIIIAVSFLSLGIVIEHEKNDNFEEENEKRIKNENTISMMLETEAGSGNYEMTTASSWPTEGYFFNSELSKCENGGELSWDDANKRVLMSGNTSDKCYVYFDKPLEFYLDDVLFQAAPNMTWEEWLNSSYSDNLEYEFDSLKYNKSVLYNRDDIIDKVSSEYEPMISDTYKNSLVFASSLDTTTHPLIVLLCVDDINSNRLSTSTDIKYNEPITSTFLKAKSLFPTEETNNKYATYIYSLTCLSPNTLIDVEEIDEKGKKRRRHKKLKDIKVGDKVICINPVTLELETDTVVECDGEMNKKYTCYDNWYFDDETIITTVHRHRFYNVENNKFMYMEEWNIGEHGINIDNKKIKLIKHEHIEEEINHCTLFTEKYNNYFANGLLSGNRRSKNIQL